MFLIVPNVIFLRKKIFNFNFLVNVFKILVDIFYSFVLSVSLILILFIKSLYLNIFTFWVTFVFYYY